MYRTITIQKARRGFLCTVGCTTICFGEGSTEKGSLIDWLRDYIRDPEDTESRFYKEFPDQDTMAPLPTPPTEPGRVYLREDKAFTGRIR